MISSGSTGYDSKIWEHVKYWYDVQAWLPKNMVVANKAAWEGLDETLKKVVLEAAANAEKAGWAKARELSTRRASCREKEGQYMERSVVDVTLKQKTKEK